MVDELFRRMDTLDVKITRSGFGCSATQIESFALFNDWRQILFAIPRDESEILHKSAASIDKLLHVHLDKLSKKDPRAEQKFLPSQNLFDDLTTGIYAWGRTAKEDENSPERAEAMIKKFSNIPEKDKNLIHVNRSQAYSDLYSALVYCWSQASQNDKASEKCLRWFREIQAKRITSKTWNALLRIHVRQKKFLDLDRNLLNQYKHLNDGHTFVSIVEGWMSSAVPDRHNNAFKELQRGIAYCIEKEEISALRQLLFVYLSETINQGYIIESERVMDQAIEIQENHIELEILDLKHFTVVMSALTKKGDIDGLTKLYQRLKILHNRVKSRLQPDYQIMVIVLSAIAKKQDLESLKVGETLVSTVETYMLEDQSPDTIFTNHAHNILLNSYAEFPGINDRTERIESLMERMRQLSILHNNPSLLPDKVSYAALMKAIIKEDETHSFSRLNDILGKMEHSDQISMQPDQNIYTIVLETLCRSTDRSALVRAKELVERMEKYTKCKPDTLMFTTLLKIHSVFNDVHGSDKLLCTMIEAYNAGRPNCRPSEDTFMMAMHPWEDSGRRDAPDAAFRIFNKMVDLYNKGNSTCRPTSESFGKLMIILAKSDHNLKMQMARRIFSEMKKHRVEPDYRILNWYIRVCATNNCTYQSDQRENWNEALATFNIMRRNGTANANTYNMMFRACGRLLHNKDDQSFIFRDLFSMCQEDGHVNRKVLTSLRLLLPPKVYRELTTLNPRDNIHMKRIPESWKRNIYKKWQRE